LRGTKQSLGRTINEPECLDETYSRYLHTTIFIGVVQHGVEIASKQAAGSLPRNDGLVIIG